MNLLLRNINKNKRISDEISKTLPGENESKVIDENWGKISYKYDDNTFLLN